MGIPTVSCMRTCRALFNVSYNAFVKTGLIAI